MTCSTLLELDYMYIQFGIISWMNVYEVKYV